MSAAPALSVVVVSWNSRDLVGPCLRSVRREAATVAGGVETVVVDNGSSDGTGDLVAADFPEALLLENAGNVGFAAACNQGIVAGQGERVLLLNPDTELREGALEEMLAALDSGPRVGIVGPRLLNPDLSLQPSCFRVPTLAREARQLFHVDFLAPGPPATMPGWSTQEQREVEVLQGACMLLRRAMLDEVGLLDEDYFMYSEEVDLCARARRAGWRVLWAPQATVVHVGGQSTRLVAERMFQELYRSKLLAIRKLHGQSSARGYKLLLAGASAVRLLVAPLALVALPHRRRTARLAARYGRLLGALPRW